jgi:hypothetical protein
VTHRDELVRRAHQHVVLTRPARPAHAGDHTLPSATDQPTDLAREGRR